MSLRSEIFEQPDVLTRLLERQMTNIQQIAAALRQKNIGYVFLAARGTSDNAGLYAKYLWGINNRLPIALAAPSLFTLYEQPPALDNALVVGISQSGQSPDIVSVLAEGKRQGTPTLTITNTPDSHLARTADFLIDIHAGDEEAIAATKTYTAELMTIAMLSVALSNEGGSFADDLRKVPDWVAQALTLDEQIAHVAERYRYMRQCVILGRGFNYATAFEWALKLKELTYVVAQPYSTADFRHGPIALIDEGFPVMAVVPRGPTYQDAVDLLRRLDKKDRAELIVISDSDEALVRARVGLRLPDELPEWLSPIVSAVLAQLFCYHLTCAKGLDPDRPRGLTKVTRTI